MRPLARSLRSAGFQTLAISYPSRRKSLEDIVDYLNPAVSSFAARTGEPVHFVTHSLGGLVVRAFLAAHPPANLGRVVMLAPPNGGSEWANLLLKLNIGNLVLGPVSRHLMTSRHDDDEAMLASPHYPVGVIAGDRALDPLFPRLVVPRPNDGKVSVAATKVAGMTDHIVLPVTHTLMVYDRRVKAQVESFLLNAAFDR